MNITAIIPEGYNSTFKVNFDGDSVSNMSVIGTGELETYMFELDPPRPDGDSRIYNLGVTLSSEGVTTDETLSNFKVVIFTLTIRH